MQQVAAEALSKEEEERRIGPRRAERRDALFAPVRRGMQTARSIGCKCKGRRLQRRRQRGKRAEQAAVKQAAAV